MNEHPFPNSDKLYILPCIQEKQATGGMDKENIPGRPSACFQDAVDVSKKMNNSLAKICVGDNMNNNTLCTYDGALEYIGNKRTSCSSEVVWNYITDFINRRNFDQSPQSTKNFFIVSHHNTLKQSILANVLKAQKKLTKEKFHIANCSCFLLEYTEEGWTFTIVFDGFPDKPKYNYFTGEIKLIDMEVKCAVYKNGEPCPYYMYSRSSTPIKYGLILANSVGIIDCGYRGNLMASFYNTKKEPVTISQGTRLVQICMPSLSYDFSRKLVDKLDSTERGEGGFGSTGK